MKKKMICLLTLAALFLTGTAQAVLAEEGEHGYAVTLKEDALMLLGDAGELEMIPQMPEMRFADSMEEIETYIGMENVERIEEVQPLILFDMPDDTLYDSQWNYTMIRGEYARLAEVTGKNVRVAVLDSGINKDHLDFVGADIEDGKNFSKNSETDLVDPDDMTDGMGHGTKVVSILAAQTDNKRGMCGIAPDVTIVPLRCFNDKGAGNDLMAAQAIYAAVDDYDCDIINMSFGQKTSTTYFEAAVKYAHEKGVIVVGAAGNFGGTDYYYPAAYDEVVGVAMVGQDGLWNADSQHNDQVTVAAPGSGVLAVNYQNTGGYVYTSGTSFAAPAVSALAALVLQADSSVTPAEFMTLLQETAVDKGEEGYDNYYGYGIIDVESALKAVGTELTPVSAEKTAAGTGFMGFLEGGIPETVMKIAIAGYDSAGRMQGFVFPKYTADKIGVMEISEEMAVSYDVFDGFRLFLMKDDGQFVPYKAAEKLQMK